ncbi:MAG: hypothetical protein U9Q69_02650, partial [Nanoarchaeota archaeon]|nr:hypothetical protein [Nanoarchaeota archaeon]
MRNILKKITGVFTVFYLGINLGSIAYRVSETARAHKPKIKFVEKTRNLRKLRLKNIEKRLKDDDFKLEDKEFLKKYGAMTYKEAIKEVDTLEKAMKYRDSYLQYIKDEKVFNQSDYHASFKWIHTNTMDDCDGFAYAIAALLSDDGYFPMLLGMGYKAGDKKIQAHLMFLYVKDGKFGALGIGPNDDCHPKYDTIDDLVKSKNYRKYKVLFPSLEY